MISISADIEQYLSDDIETLRDTEERIVALIQHKGGYMTEQDYNTLNNVQQAIRMIEEYDDD